MRRVVERDHLIARIWPGLHVAEGNLRVQVSTLRRMLGDGVDGARYAVSVAGRGYSFVAPVVQTPRSPPLDPAAATPTELP
jgi:DNA-binding winged helix-turn-helix (wHTH) protein